MNIDRKLSRRILLETGIASLAASQLLAQERLRPARVLFLVGDFCHNGAMQEYSWRRLLKSTGWRLMFAQAPRFVTDEVMAAADLYVLCRYATDTQDPSFSLGFSPDKIVESRSEPDVFMTAE